MKRITDKQIHMNHRELIYTLVFFVVVVLLTLGAMYVFDVLGD